jgi:hypothetical protein
MPKYFVHENRHYPCPGARAPFGVRSGGFIDNRDGLQPAEAV